MASNEEVSQLTLNECFKKAMYLVQKIEDSDLPSNSQEMKELIDECIDVLTSAKSKVAMLNLFSDNEEIDEISSNSIKYFLIPIFLADVSLKQAMDRNNRINIVKKAEESIKEYLELCKNYGVGSFSMINNALKQNNSESTNILKGSKDTKYLMDQRSAKIEKFKQEKLLKEKLSSLKCYIDDENADDEKIREFWITLIEKWIMSGIDLLQSIKEEKEMLNHMQLLQSGDYIPTPVPENTHKPMKPFILTRDAVQAKVFGAGYPSLPTMTVEEYAKLEMESLSKRMNSQNIQNGKNNEDDDDNETDEKVYKQREFDDWKDTHRRGEGNRKNMG